MSAGYVAAAVCARCHKTIAESYAATGMGHSFSLPGTARQIEDYSRHNRVEHGPSGLTYTMVERDGAYFQRRSEKDWDGRETNIVEEQIDYVIGSGNHARSYLHRNPDGTLVELPVSWYAEGGGSWAMSPGYDRKDQEDFRRTVPGECLLCHDGFPPRGTLPDRGKSGIAIFPLPLATGIDCQRCHGPGSAHIRAALAGASVAAIRSAIVNPARLNRDRQMDVCMQCHLETSSGLLPNEIRRYDLPIDVFRPGGDLGDVRFYFDRRTAAEENGRFEIDNAGYRLRMSACYRKSQMTCLTCHDPHQPYRSPAAEKHYLQACGGCHESVRHTAALPAGEDCITCHMPKRRTQDVVHVVMTDHFIQSFKSNRDLLAPLTENTNKANDDRGILLYYPAQVASTPEGELYLATAAVRHGFGLSEAAAHLRVLIRRYSPAAPEFYFELGDGYARLGDSTEAKQWYEMALRRRPEFRPALKQLSSLEIGSGHYAEAVTLLREAAAHPPDDAELWTNLGNAYLHLGELAPAAEALNRALALRPDLADAQNLQGLLSLRRKDSTGAARWFRSALRSRPDDAEARSNLGKLLAANHHYAEAAYQFRRAAEFEPGNVEALRSYGSMLALQQHGEQALEVLDRALALQPKDTQTLTDLGDVLSAQGKAAEAEERYRQALALNPRLPDAECSLANLVAADGRLDDARKEFVRCLQFAPDDFEAHLGLGLILKAQGQIAAARRECQRALESDDPQIRGTAEAALHEISSSNR